MTSKFVQHFKEIYNLYLKTLEYWKLLKSFDHKRIQIIRLVLLVVLQILIRMCLLLIFLDQVCLQLFHKVNLQQMVGIHHQ